MDKGCRGEYEERRLDWSNGREIVRGQKKVKRLVLETNPAGCWILMLKMINEHSQNNHGLIEN